MGGGSSGCGDIFRAVVVVVVVVVVVEDRLLLLLLVAQVEAPWNAHVLGKWLVASNSTAMTVHWNLEALIVFDNSHK